jgi:hypothetical protein
MNQIVFHLRQAKHQPPRYTAFASDTSRADDTRHACFAGTSEKRMPDSKDSR